MKYYRVKKEFDDCIRWKICKSGRIKEYGSFIRNELYTPREVEKLANSLRMYDEVEISKNNTYTFFGSRFEIGKNHEWNGN